MKHELNAKIKLILDHQGKPLKRPIYGYVIARTDFTDNYKDGVFTEKDTRQTIGEAYLIQTSWTGCAIWYSGDAIKAAGGKHELAEWRRNLQDYHDAEAMKHGAY